METNDIWKIAFKCIKTLSHGQKYFISYSIHLEIEAKKQQKYHKQHRIQIENCRNFLSAIELRSKIS